LVRINRIDMRGAGVAVHGPFLRSARRTQLAFLQLDKRESMNDIEMVFQLLF
jgi:hypothetical protein